MNVYRFTDRDKLAEVEREIAFRRTVYARKVAEGRMKQTAATAHLAIMEAIAADYRAKVQPASGQQMPLL